MIFEKLIPAEDRYKEIEQMMTLPSVVSNAKEYSSLIKEYKSLEPVIEKFREYKAAEQEMEEADAMMRDSSLDSDLRDFAEIEFKTSRERIAVLDEELRLLLAPKDPNDSRNVIIEIRQGAGGGGTVAMYIANHNIETVDLGVPVISMHAPYEVISKADIYTTHEAFLAFLK